MRYASLFLTPVLAISLSAQPHPLLERSPMFDILDSKTIKSLQLQLVKLVPSLNNWHSLSYSEEEKLLDKMLPNRSEIARVTANDPELKKQLRDELDKQLERIFLPWLVKHVGTADRLQIADKFIPR